MCILQIMRELEMSKFIEHGPRTRCQACNRNDLAGHLF